MTQFVAIAIFVLVALASTLAFNGFSNSRMVRSRDMSMKIPPFNWPGSKMPPSPLESLFSGGGSSASTSTPVKRAAPAATPKVATPAPTTPAKKASPFSFGGSKPAAKTAAPAAATKVAAPKAATPAPAKKASPFSFGGSKPTTKAAAPAPAAPAKKESGRDMTWGGRPDPTPELFVDNSADFWGFAKSLGKKK